MKNKEQDKIIVYSTTLKSDKLEKSDLRVIEESYCPNGHSLISGYVYFFDYKAIQVRIRYKNKVSDLFISPVIGDKCKVSFDTQLKNDIEYEFLCPECNTGLPVASPCSCGGKLIAVYLDKSLKLSKSVTICNKFGCPHSEVQGIENLKTIHL